MLRRLAGALVALLLALEGARPACAADATPPRVYIVLVDGLDASRFAEAHMPTLWNLAHEPRSTFYTDGRSVMPTVTNTNHAAILTGAYTAAHGIVGNAFWERGASRPTRSEQARFLEVETVFTVLARERPTLQTGALFGKSRLVGLCTETASGQRRPAILWGDSETETEPIDARLGYASDARTMNELLRVLAANDPAFVLTALPDVDRTSHVFGPDSQEAWRALLEADRQIERLIGFLKARGTWADTVIIVTADHGFVSVAPDAAAGRAYPLVLFGRTLAAADIGGLTVFSEGPLESILVAGGLDDAGAALLARVRALALAQPEIAEAWYRRPNPADGGAELTAAHARPQWRMDHPRSGDLVLLAKPGFTFSDPFSPSTAAMVGMHGGPETSHIPIVVTGGWPRLRNGRAAGAAAVPPAANPDLGATALWLLGAGPTRRLDGSAVPSELAGRVLHEAFADAGAPAAAPSPR